MMTPRSIVGDRAVIASVSGGKDSAALVLHLREHGIECAHVFADTGWEHPETYAYLRGELTRVLGPIVEVKGDTLPNLVRRKGMFPSRKRRFCTSELKVKPLATFARWYADELGAEVLSAIGVRANESAARATALEIEWSDDFDCDVWRPILRWTEADVIAIHKRHGLKPNPLYLAGASRVGCWPCIHARKAEIRAIVEGSPERIDEIRALEAEVQAGAIARAAAKGETVESLGHMLPTFFQGPMREPCKTCGGSGVERACADPNHDDDGDDEIGHECSRVACPRCKGLGVRRGMWPIDKVAGWSRTSRGGVHLEMFADPNDGCARWGMCEPTGGAL